MEINKKRATFMVLLAMFITFTLAYTSPSEAVIYNWECQDDTLRGFWNGSVNGETVNVTQDVECTYGCTNLSYPPQCVISPKTDTWTRPLMQMPIFILLEIVALIFLVIGTIFRSEDGKAYMILPLLALTLFFTLAITAINIDGEMNLVMMLLNYGLAGISLIYVFFELLTGKPMQRLIDET